MPLDYVQRSELRTTISASKGHSKRLAQRAGLTLGIAAAHLTSSTINDIMTLSNFEAGEVTTCARQEYVEVYQMQGIPTAIQELRNNPKGIRFSRLAQVCDHFFGPSRRHRTSHLVYRTPWPGDPRVNIQEGRNGLAKAYQVRQVIKALEKLQKELGSKQ